MNKIIKLDKCITDFERIFNIVLDKKGIESLKDDIYRKFSEMCINIGDTFSVEYILYKKTGSFENKEVKLFNFILNSQKFSYITDEDTGEQDIDEVNNIIIEYLGYN